MFRFFGYRSFEPEYETMKKMRTLGIRTIPFMVSNNCNFMGEPYTRYQPTWIWEREYDFTRFDKNVADILDAVPDAELIMVLDLNPPQWWLRRGTPSRRFDPFNEFGRVAASEEYREDVVDYLQAILRHAMAKYPKRFVAVAVMGGKTTEWFDWSFGIESFPRIEAWNRYRREHGRPVIPVPSMEERYSGVPESGGLLRTPATHADALDYWKFNSLLSAETVSLFLTKAREVLPPEIGITICYGYVFEIGRRHQCTWAQLEYERVFDLPALDFALEPISYGAAERGMGGSPISMIPMQTLKVRGKNILNSIDTTTFTSRFPKAPGKSGSVPIMSRGVEWHTPAEVTAGIRREMCFNLINGCSTWYFDMWGGWYDNDAAVEALRECRRIWETESKITPADAFEVLQIVDPENMYLINDVHEEAMSFVTPVRKALRDAGAPFTTASFRDLEKMDLSRYKVLIFCHPFDLDGGKWEAIRKIGAGKTVVWIWAPGIVHGGKWDPEHMRRIAGAEYGSHEIVFGDGEVFVPEPGKLAAADVRRIYAAAGVHIWCDGAEPVVANDRLASLHLAGAGRMTFHLPRRCAKVTELFGNREYRDVADIEIETSGPETLLFRYGEE